MLPCIKTVQNIYLNSRPTQYITAWRGNIRNIEQQMHLVVYMVKENHTKWEILLVKKLLIY